MRLQRNMHLFSEYEVFLLEIVWIYLARRFE